MTVTVYGGGKLRELAGRDPRVRDGVLGWMVLLQEVFGPLKFKCRSAKSLRRSSR